MPNYITNLLEIEAEPDKVHALIQKYTTKAPAHIRRNYFGNIICKHKETNECGWFNEKTGEFLRKKKETVIGLPEGWEMEVAGEKETFPDFNKIKPQPENLFKGDLGEKEMFLCEETGIPNWYNWNMANWGVKWNCSSCERQAWNVFTFETAWSGVPGLIIEMSKQNPGVKFIYKYSDEDTGSNCDSFEFLDGEVVKHLNIKSRSVEAFELAFELRPYLKELYKLENGEYKYVEQE